MQNMTNEEIIHLGRLARIALAPGEVAVLRTEIDAILSYVSTVKNIAGDTTSAPLVGARFNVLRPDVIQNESGQFTDVLLAAMPKRDGQYLSVKKILNQPE